MARLDPTPYPGDWSTRPGEPIKDYLKRTEALFEAIDDDHQVRFQYADGYAYYYLKSRKPLILQHVPYGDAWRLPPRDLAALRLADIEAIIATERGLRSIFGARSR